MISLVAVIGLVAACTASPSLYFGGPQYYSGYYPAAVVSPIKSQYHSQNEQGQYAYGYNDGYSSKAETKHANGLTEGAYSYVDPNGVLQQYRYVSDENGYRVSGTNLPAAPVPAYAPAAVPVAYAAAPVAVAEIPQPVQDTPEVAAAKAAHQVAYDQAKKAADEAPAAEEASVDYAPTPVQDTPEVAAAKAAHQVAHEQAKQANGAYVAYPSYAVAAPAPAPAASYAYAVAPAPAYVAVSSSNGAEVPQQVQDTPEVAAAKAAHQAAFEQAKKAAEEAPSDDGSSAPAEQPASDAVSVTAAVTKTPAVAYSYQSAYPSSYAVAAPAPVASYAYAAAPAYNYAVAAPAAYGYAAAAPSYAYAPFAAGSYSPVHSQYHSQDEFGQYSYGYNSGSSSKAEVKTLDGVTRGGYSYVDSNGIVQHYNYVSDPVNGFRVAGTNLPSNTL